MNTWQPLARNIEIERSLPDEGENYIYEEIWENDIYHVALVRNVKEPIWPTGMTWLTITRLDKQPCDDWRAFQFIKNQLVGEECEALQLYPAESRLMDIGNYAYLFCLPDKTMRLPFGFNSGRALSETPVGEMEQRPWPDNMKPHDLEEQSKKIQEMDKLY